MSVPSAPGPGTERPESQRLYERACESMPRGNSRTTVFAEPFPSYAASGKGCHLIDADGNEYVDFLNNYTSLLHGHASPPIVDALSAQLRLGTAFSMPTALEIELAEEITARVPSVESVRFTNSGTEAVMVAVHAARAATGRDMIAKCEGAYHGFYDSVAVSVGVGSEQWGPHDRPNAVPESAGATRDASSRTLVLPYNDVEASKRLIAEHRDELAAVVVDPLPNRAGLIPAEQPYLEMLRAVTAAHGIVLLFDEVISFRLHRGGAQGWFGVTPDLTSFAKVIGGGLPVGALGGRRDVMDVLAPGGAVPHGGTFNANPLSMVAGKAALDAWTETEIERLNALGGALRARLNAAFRAAGVPGKALGAGSLFRIHAGEIGTSGYRDTVSVPGQADMWPRIRGALNAHGVHLARTGLGCLSTPMGEDEIDRFVEAFGLALETVG